VAGAVDHHQSACGYRMAKNSPMATGTTGSAFGWMMVVGGA
jgi:hypothetical protein